MTRNEVYEQLNAVFRDVFDDESLTVADETTAADVEDWDSLTHITLIAAVEDAFDISFDMKTVVRLKCVGDMVDAILQEL
ncbi:MAG: acyl carrier protein [Clostridia bacterium]|nr:acyl carrier protein [Clostridia bacterium]